MPKILQQPVIWVGIFGVVLVGYAFRDDLSGVAARVFGELVPGSAIVDTEAGTATFRRDRGGHFEVVASVNGARVPLIFDTGATAVVLTQADARGRRHRHVAACATRSPSRPRTAPAAPPASVSTASRSAASSAATSAPSSPRRARSTPASSA